MAYNELIPHKNVETSIEAAESLSEERAEQLRSGVLSFINQSGSANFDEAAEALMEPVSSISAAFTRLHEDQEIVRTKTKRKTRRKRNSFVFVINEGTYEHLTLVREHLGEKVRNAERSVSSSKRAVEIHKERLSIINQKLAEAPHAS